MEETERRHLADADGNKANMKDRLRRWFFEEHLAGFELGYFVIAGMTFNGYLAQHWYLTAIAAVLVLWAAVRFFLLLPQLKQTGRYPLAVITLIMFVAYGITTILNREYGITENLQAMVWLGMCFFILYPDGFFGSLQGRAARIRRFCNLVLAYADLQAIWSLYLIMTNTRMKRAGFIVGLLYGRMWGTYTDPNYGAILSAVGILLSFIYLAQGKKQHKYWWIFPVNILLLETYMAGSYSRSGLIVLIVGLALFFLYRIVYCRPRMTWMLLYVAAAAFLILIPPVLRNAYNSYAEQQNAAAQAAYEAQVAEAGDEKVKKPKQWEQFWRIADDASGEEGESSDISDGRFAIWSDGIMTFRDAPLFGVSYRNILQYLEANHPDCYMVNHNMPLNTFHNALIDVLASQGLAGFIPLLIAIGYILVRSVRSWILLNAAEREEAILLGIPVVMIICGAIFISDIFYVNSPTTVIFWYLLGQWMGLMHRVRNRSRIVKT